MAAEQTVPDLTPSTRERTSPAATRAGLPGQLAARRFGLPASYWRRIIARLLDALTIFWLLFALVITGAAFWVHALAEEITPAPWGKAFISTLSYAALLLIYEVIFLAARGQTPGKDVMKIKVIRSIDGKKPTVRQAFRRSSFYALLSIVPHAWLASCAQFLMGITAVRSPLRRSIGDVLADTQVVYYDDPDDRPRVSVWDRTPLRIGGFLARR